MLGGAAMPAILIEIGFLTNPKEEKKLATPAYRESVARGSMEYSAVTQPSPLPLRQRGTPSVTEAVQKTFVSPKETRTEPSGWRR